MNDQGSRLERQEDASAPAARAGADGDGATEVRGSRDLSSLRSLLAPEPPGTRRAPDVTGEWATGQEPPLPEDRIGEALAVNRTFAFIDITGFTEYCDTEGEHRAIALLTKFRTVVRDVVGRRGVRVAKWLGDGVMIVGVNEGPSVATAAEVVLRSSMIGIDTHAGVATGTALLFEGDDYVGRPANLAARLCDVAEPGEILAALLEGPLPSWLRVKGEVSVAANGMGDVAGVLSIGVTDEIAEQVASGGAAA